MGRVLVVLATALLGCVQDDLVDCGNGIACPAGTACAALAGESFCVPPGDIAACAGRDPFAACDLADGTAGACYVAEPELVCLPAGCGNGRLDPGEVCDDGNAFVGDGCSANCLSDETCGNEIVDPVRGEQCDDGDLVGHDGCASACTPESPQWTPVITGLPGAAFHQASAYDAARRRLVIFGGAFQTGNFNQVARGDTWEWDGTGFTQMFTPIAPAARWGSSLVYDPVRRRSVLFGGGSGGQEVTSDTWEWDGETWTLLAPPTLPPRRQGAASAWDPERDRVVIAGGRSGMQTLDDMWEWDGVTWTQVATTLPARAFGAMTYDPQRGVMVLVAGQNADSTIADTWERRGGQWMSIAPSPAQLRLPVSAYDGVDVLTFGGHAGNTSVRETWRWNGTAWTQLAPATQPPARELGVLARDPIGGRVILAGGHFIGPISGTNSTYADAHAWQGSTATWQPLGPTTVTGRAFHAAAFDSLRGKLVVFGGSANMGTGVVTTETLEFDGGHWTSTTASGPAARFRTTATYDAARGEVVMFGGNAANNAHLDETWLWNGTRWLLATPAMKPSARDSVALAYDPVRERVVLFGGATGAALADTWEWDGATWTRMTPVASPPPRARASMTYDPLRRRMVLVGGAANNADHSDAWEYDGTTWTKVAAPQEPPARSWHAAAWHGSRGSLVMFGGVLATFSQYDDTWELRGSAWTQQPIAERPEKRNGHSTSQLPDGSGVLVFGGLLNNNTGSAELWRLRWSNDRPHELCTLDVDNDGDGSAGCADPDCWARCSPLCPPGAVCDPSWPRCGDGSCNAALEDCHLCPMDCTCTPVCGDTFCDPGESCPGDC
jgi:cysteine-rich repeat protein